MRQVGDGLPQAVAARAGFGGAGLVVHGQPFAQGVDHGDDFLAVDLEGTADARQAVLLEAGEAVQAGCFHQVAAAAEQAGGVESAEVLGAVPDQVGAPGGVFLETVHRVHAAGRVDDDRDAVVVGDVDRFTQGNYIRTLVVGWIEYGQGIAADGIGEFFRGSATGSASVDDAHPGHAHHPVVFVALRFLHDDFVFHITRFGQADHPVRVVSGHAGGRAQDQGCRAAGSDQRGFAIEHFGDEPAGAGQEFVHVDVVAAGQLHGLLDPGRRSRATEHSHVADGIDHGSGSHLGVELAG